MKCPTCNRAIRQKKPRKDETPEEAHRLIMAKTRAAINARLRSPMSPKTPYKE